MSLKIIEMKQKRAKLIEDQRAILNKAESEKRAMTADEETQYNAMDADFEKLTSDLDREEKLQKRELDLAAQQRSQPSGEQRGNGNAPEIARIEWPKDMRHYSEAFSCTSVRASTEYNAAFRSALANGLRGITPDEFRALQADSDILGGYMVMPEQFVANLIIALKNQVFVRQYATTIPVIDAASLGVPSLDSDIGDPTWTAEIKTGSEDSSMGFGKRELRPHPLARRIKVSNKLIRISAIGVDSLVRERLSYVFGVVEENAFLNGTGAQQPLGVFTASSQGISTSRDVSTGNTSTNVGADGLIEAKYSLKAQYQKTARWIFHRNGIKRIRKLKDGEGNYLWKAGLTDKPDTILELPFDMSEYAPDTWTTGLYVGILGDFSFYWIADALNMQIQVLDQLYAETNQVGYIGRKETDGMPVLEEAFARVKLA